MGIPDFEVEVEVEVEIETEFASADRGVGLKPVARVRTAWGRGRQRRGAGCRPVAETSPHPTRLKKSMRRVIGEL